MFESWPFTNFHDMNLDWIIKTIKTYTQKVDDLYDTGLYNYVEKVLAAHPEWTTTVENGAITKPKINSSFLPEIENYYITPQMFGAVGDGVTDDTAAIQNAINSSDINTVFIPEGTYVVTSPIVIKHSDQTAISHSIIMARNAVLKAGAPINSVLHFQLDHTHINNNMRDYLDGEVLESGNIDGAGLAAYGVIIEGNGRMSCNTTNIYDATIANLWVKSGRFNAWNLEITNNFNYVNHNDAFENVIGILNDSSDSHFWDCYLSWCKYGIVNNAAGFYERIHGVMGNYGYNGSVFVQQGYDSISTFEGMYSDNYQTSYKSKGTATFSNVLSYFWMTAAELAVYDPPVVFDLSELALNSVVTIDGLEITPHETNSDIIGLKIVNNIQNVIDRLQVSNITALYNYQNNDWLAYYISKEHNKEVTPNDSFYNGRYIHLYDLIVYNFNKSIDATIKVGAGTNKFKAEYNLHINTVQDTQVIDADGTKANGIAQGFTNMCYFYVQDAINTMKDGSTVNIISIWVYAGSNIGSLLMADCDILSEQKICLPVRMRNASQSATPGAIVTTRVRGMSTTYHESACEIGGNGTVVRFTTMYDKPVNPSYTPSIDVVSAALICNGTYNNITGTTTLVQTNNNSATWQMTLDNPLQALNNMSGVLRLSAVIDFN